MRNFFRTPITWLVVAEFIVVGALIVVAWNAVSTVGRPVLASPPLLLPGTGADQASPLPDLPGVSKPKPGSLPGLNLDSYFWWVRLAQLNREQVYFEQLEWQIVHSAMDALQRYVQTVMVPSIQRAEHAGG